MWLLKQTAVLLVAGALVITGASWCAVASSANGSSNGKENWKALPVIPRLDRSVGSKLRLDVANSRSHSMRPRVFAKLGDSNTSMPSSIYGLGCSRPRLHGRWRLGAVLKRYNQVTLFNPRPLNGCSSSTSFSRTSVAAQAGTFAGWSLKRIDELPPSGYSSAPPGCGPTETPMSCEIRVTRPRYVFIMTGTNDWILDNSFDVVPGSRTEADMNSLIDSVRALGSVPIVSTLPPLMISRAGEAAIDPYNRAIAASARKKKAPLVNLWRALSQPRMINSGMDDKGLHLRVVGGETPVVEPGPDTLQDSVNFDRESLRVGSNRRNLILLQTLAALDRVTGLK